jgi:hypothetical protein
MTEPFRYPAARHVRRHGPRGYRNYESFRPWLRDEFVFRCVYCLQREQWGRVKAVFDLDHFRAVATHPSEVGTYDNLIFACTTCNSAKQGLLIPDPTIAFIQEAIRVQQDGRIETSTAEAERLVDLLGLNHESVVTYRRWWIEVIELARKHKLELYRRLMGFPDDLPDLSNLRPPEGNLRPEGVHESYFARRARGELPETY